MNGGAAYAAVLSSAAGASPAATRVRRRDWRRAPPGWRSAPAPRARRRRGTGRGGTALEVHSRRLPTTSCTPRGSPPRDARHRLGRVVRSAVPRAVRRRRGVAPGIAPAVLAPCRLFPFRLGGQPLPDPAAVVARPEPRYLHGRMVPVALVRPPSEAARSAAERGGSARPGRPDRNNPRPPRSRSPRASRNAANSRLVTLSRSIQKGPSQIRCARRLVGSVAVAPHGEGPSVYQHHAVCHGTSPAFRRERR